MAFTVLIRNGYVFDGTGNPWLKADVGIENGKISKVGELKSAAADVVIDANGLAVAPGFIDIHAHSDLVLASRNHPELLDPFIRQGVTTQVIGNCGMSPAPVKKETVDMLKGYLALITVEELPWTWSSLGDYLNLLEKQGVAMNVAALIGHGTIRTAIMGAKSGTPTKEEMKEMKFLASQAMQEGAFGMSAGLIYPPGMWSTTEELIELCKVVSDRNGTFTCHVRGSSETLIYAVREIVKIGEKTGVRIEHSHHEAFGKAHWWKVNETIRMEEKARADGIDIGFDVIPYTSANTTLLAIYPPWSLEGGVPKLIERLEDSILREKIGSDIEEVVPGWPPWLPGSWPHNLVEATGWENIVLMHVPSEKNRYLVGKSLVELGKIMGKSPFNATSDLVIEENGDIMALFIGVSGDMTNGDHLQILLKHPLAAVTPDAIIRGKGITHPGAYGCFPRVLGHYARELKLFTMEDAVRKMTSLPAQRIGLRYRGLIKEGFYADITIFDPKKIIDKSTYSEPSRYPGGIEYVLINGKVVFEKGEYHKEVLAGKVLRKYP